MTGQNVKREPWETPCKTDGKLLYTSRKAAKLHARELYPGQHMQVYACHDDENLWHIGHIPQAVKLGIVSRRDLKPPRQPRSTETHQRR